MAQAAPLKIMVVIGSPKGEGAGYRIVKKIESKMKAMGEVEFSYLFLKDANLKFCTGCYKCMSHGEDKCPLKDGRDDLEAQLLLADGVILSSPVHVANVSALMKNFMDRFAYRNHRPIFFRQKVLTVVNMAGSDKASIRYTLGGSELIAELQVATPPWPQPEAVVERKEKKIEKAAFKFFHACQKERSLSPTLTDLIKFNLMQALVHECRQYLPADYAYYKDRTFYYDAKINILTNALARLVVRISRPWIRDLGPGPVAWPKT